jgi:hypothetical protein
VLIFFEGVLQALHEARVNLTDGQVVTWAHLSKKWHRD